MVPVDADGDGFSEGDGDCDDQNPDIYPGAIDHFNDGIDSNCNGVQDVIETLAGTGDESTSGDGGDPLEATLAKPNGIAVDDDDSIFISEEGGNVIRVIRPDGNIYRFAGVGGEGGFDGDDDDALDARLNKPHGLDITDDGSVLVADKNNNRIRAIWSGDGKMYTIAGDGGKGYDSDFEVADETKMNRPTGVALDDFGGYYIADKDNHRVRWVGPGGLMWLVCGDGNESSSGDGSDYYNATVDAPFDVLNAADDSVYISESGGSFVRRYVPLSYIETVVGDGDNSGADDWVDPEELNLGTPRGLTEDKWGRIYIADEARDAIFQIREDGLARRVVGTGAGGFSGDGGFAGEAQLKDPRFLGVLSDGSLIIADRSNHRVRIVRW